MSQEGTGKLAQDPDFDFPIAIATMPATAAQRRTAIVVVVLLAGLALAVAPIANIQLGRIDAFIPVLQTVLSVADLMTATLLFAQYSIFSQPALLVLASGYVFSGSFAFLQTLAFPGSYSPAGLIGDGTNSAAWFFVLWHAMFLGAVLLYGLTKERDFVPVRGSTRMRIAGTLAGVLLMVGCLSWVATAGVEHLPKFYANNVTLQTPLGNRVNLTLCSLAIAALAILFARRRTILDVWLMVILLAWIPNFLVAAVASSVRFSVGWYAARGFALVASCMLLSVLLTEMTFLYSRLANALTLQRRERSNRLMSVEAATAAMAHELRTPLGSIALNANSALCQLRANAPDLKELGTILEDIEATSYRAGKVISSIRELSARAPSDRRTMTGVEDIARQVLGLVQHDLQINQISVATDFGNDLPRVRVDTIQLQQVILNLVKNAIEAMSQVAPDARLLKLGVRLEGHETVLSVADSGTGIPPEDHDRIFEPFFSTKPAGMGLGLAICRTVVENHGGKLRLAKSDSHGSIFEIATPTGA